MSTIDYKDPVESVPNSTSPSSTPNDLELNIKSTTDSHFDSQMLIKVEFSPEPSIESPVFTADVPNHDSQSTNPVPDIELPPEYATSSFGYMCGNSRQANLFLFTPDGSYTSLSPHILDMKDLDKGDSAGAILSSRPLSNSSMSTSSNASPKPFMTLQLNEAKNDKMISGFDGRLDALSPLSVIAVSSYQDTGHPSPNTHSRSHPVLRYHPSGDAMLSALNYNETDMLQDGGFDVPSSGAFSALDGLLGTSMSGSNASGIRLPDLLDSDMSQEGYIEVSQDLELSPQPFSGAGDSFTVSESTSLASLNEASDALGITGATRQSSNPENTNLLLVDKLKVKNCRPVKATSPSRPGTQPCPTCGKVFSNSSALTKHKLTHSDERKYGCTLCGKAFKRQDHLNGHMLTHRNKKPFQCDAEGCGKSYCDARSLRRHKENHHSTPATAAPLPAPALGKQVTVIPALAAHIANLSSLQSSSFPASVITSNSSALFPDSTLGNRIQYAPPPPTSTATHTPVIKTEDGTKASERSHVGSLICPTKLQYLAYQPQTSLQSTIVTTAIDSKTENTVLASWPAQTINTGALLLSQNLDISQRPQKSAQLITGGYSVSSPSDQKKELSSDTSNQFQASKVVSEPQEGLPENIKQDPSPVESMSSTEFEKRLEIMNVNADPRANFSEMSTSNLGVFRSEHSSVQIKVEHLENDAELSVCSKEGSECQQIQSPLLQQLLNQQQGPELNSAISQSFSDSSYLSVLPKAKQGVTNTSQHQVLVSQWPQMRYTVSQSTVSNPHKISIDPKPVECSLCQRKFKNTPALNGHMRLHGGYFKKENESKKNEKKLSSMTNNSNSHLPLTTASTNVRALIEEKIIQKRNFVSQNGLNSSTNSSQTSPGKQVFEFHPTEIPAQSNSPYIAQTSPMMSPVEQDAPVFVDFPVTSQNSSIFDSCSADNSIQVHYDWFKSLHLKESFRVPHPPAEKHRRHSDSDHFIPAKRPCMSHTNSALADLLRRKVVAKRTSRTGSDPGEPLIFDSLPFSELSSSSSSLSLDFLPKFSKSFSTLQNAFDESTSDLQRVELTTAVSEDSILPILSAEDIPDAQPPSMVCLKNDSDMDSHSLDKNVFFDTPSTNIDVNQPFPDITVSELEMMQLTTPVTSMSALPLTAEVSESGSNAKVQSGEDSNDDDVFLSPTSLPTSPMKSKRKRRPEPLYIPPYVNTSGFTSRLRSPRLWDPSNMDHKKLSPPPYTPPPMLSPVRSGSGLFWHIISGSGSLTPKSAPITPSFGYPRKSSIGDSATDEEETFYEAPESDILPHVNIGSFYQAKLPRFNSNFKDALLCDEKADKVWDPSTLTNLPEQEVEAYLNFASSAAVPGGGNNKEYSLHLLYICKGKIQDAVLSLMDSSPKLPSNHYLLKFRYSECSKWSAEEIEVYHQGLLKCDKDFFTISKEISTKTVKQCIEFYYLWKKVCPEDYKRIRGIRRRKEHESLFYNLQNKEESNNHTTEYTQENGVEDATEHYLNSQMSANGCSQFSKLVGCITAPNEVTNSLTCDTSTYDFPIEPPEKFPCKICGKIFKKVKSRSAHMKSHRQPDGDKKSKHDS